MDKARLTKLETDRAKKGNALPIGLIEVRCSGFSDLPLEEQAQVRHEAQPEPSTYPGAIPMYTLRVPEKG